MGNTLSDLISTVILSMLEGVDEIELQRNYMSRAIGCSPAQINYVLSTRFTPEQGYEVDTRRGGGGGVTVRKIKGDKDSEINSVLDYMGCEASIDDVVIGVDEMVKTKALGECEAALIVAACCGSGLDGVSPLVVDNVRAGIFKDMLRVVVNGGVNRGV